MGVEVGDYGISEKSLSSGCQKTQDVKRTSSDPDELRHQPIMELLSTWAAQISEVYLSQVLNALARKDRLLHIFP